MSGTQRRKVKLLFLDLVNQFDTREGDSRMDEVLEAQHRPHPLFDATMVLFNEVMEIFVRPPCELGWQYVFLVHLRHRCMRGGALRLGVGAAGAGTRRREPRGVGVVERGGFLFTPGSRLWD